jgi:23S rRNA pseudouridine2605 synthase/16S rRNA pseudouridine516 synthase
MIMERLHRFLARAGIASRRKCEELIKAGLVKVNDKIVTQLGTSLDPAVDRVEVAGKKIKKPEEKLYILLNKPTGYVTTGRDPQGRPKVTDLLKNVRQRVYPVGRLDYETEGLLLLTNDGELTFALTHPRHQVEKTYLAWVNGIPPADQLAQMARGIMLSDGQTAPARVHLKKRNKKGALLEITLHEGRKRQVRRMCAQIGHPVYRLKRIKFGALTLSGLKPGQYRLLTPKEVQNLKKLTLERKQP